MSENYAEVHARPGEHIGTFAARIVRIADQIEGDVYATFNGTRFVVPPRTSSITAARTWGTERERTHVHADTLTPALDTPTNSA